MSVTKEQLVEKLDQLEKAYKEWKEVEAKLESLFGGYSWEGDLGRAVDTLLSANVELFSLTSGIELEALWWWILDAEFGKSNCRGVSGKLDGSDVMLLSSNSEFIEWEIG